MSEKAQTNPAPENTEDTAAVLAPDNGETKAQPKKPNRKKLLIIIIAAAVVVIAAIIITVIVINSNNADANIDEDIEFIDVQTGNYYTGVIEPQQTSDISKDPERTVSEVYVKVGDTVKKGDKLFEYDSNETESKLAKAKIEYESIQNDITECDNRISQLSRARSEADESQQLDYTSQIQEQESSKSQYQLNLQIKQVEIDDLQESLDNSVITSPIDGIIKQINTSSDSSSGAFITVLMNGSYRVKGQVDEMNVRDLQTGMDVVIHSRVLKDKTWKGTVSKVDTGATADKENSNMDSGNSDNAATKYNFYVTLDSSEDLLLGEHVYIEPVYDAEGEPDGEEPQEDAAPADSAEN